jgi:hypothetical protein
MDHLSPEERAAERMMLASFVAVMLIVTGALLVIGLSGSEKAQSIADVAAGGLGVIGTLGGAFVGHRLGSAGRREAEQRLDAMRRDGEQCARPPAPPPAQTSGGH